jgi:hypothetical protein
MRWPWRRPKLEDIYWLAGLVEGEGSFTSARVVIPQKDAEILERTKELFGGSVFGPILVPSINGPTLMHRWYATGWRGRGIARTLYHLMSTRRQAQIRAFLKVSRPSELPEPLSADNPTRYLADWGGGELE